MAIIALKIDVTKLDKERFFRAESGAVYADIILNLDDELKANQYGNCGFMAQSVTKEERQAGTKLPICGNAKLLSGGTPKPQPRPQPTPKPAGGGNPQPKNDFADDDSVPF